MSIPTFVGAVNTFPTEPTTNGGKTTTGQKNVTPISGKTTSGQRNVSQENNVNGVSGGDSFYADVVDDGSIDLGDEVSAPDNTGKFNQKNVTGYTGKGITDTQVPTGEIKNFNDLIKFAANMLNVLIVLCVAAATVFFMKGLLMYVHHGADEKKMAEARNYIILGIIVITAMISVYGLVRFVTNTFFKGGDTTFGTDETSFLSSPTVK